FLHVLDARCICYTCSWLACYFFFPRDKILYLTLNAHQVPSKSGVTIEKILYIGGPNIASEIYSKEYANARICGTEKWRKPLTKFFRQPHFFCMGQLRSHHTRLWAG
ncbi:unnamed protein product, partial [Musa textilis]